MIEVKNPTATIYFDRKTGKVTKTVTHRKVVLTEDACVAIAKMALKGLAAADKG